MTTTEAEIINIKDLVLDEPERKTEWIFDPKRDLTQTEWREIEQAFKRTWTDNPLDIGFAASLKFIAPEMLTDFYAQPDPFDRLNQSLSAFDEGPYRYFGFLADVKVLFPNQFSEIEISEEMTQQLLLGLAASKQEALVGNDTWQEYLFPAADLYLVLSDRKGELQLDDSIWEGAKVELAEKAASLFPPQFEQLRILFPEKEFDIPITEETLNKHRGRRDAELGGGNPIGYEDEHWEIFTKFCQDLVIAQAEEVKVTNRGLEVKPKSKPLLDLGEPIPEVREF